MNKYNITLEQILGMPSGDNLTEEEALKALYSYYSKFYDLESDNDKLIFFNILQKELLGNNKLNYKINIDDEIYHLIDFDTMTTGEFIDLDFYYKDPQYSREFMSILYRKMNEDKIESYDGSKPILFSKGTYSDYKSSMIAYLKWKEEFVSSYSYLYVKKSEEDIDEVDVDENEQNFISEEQYFAEEYGWYPMLYIAANEDFLKIEEVVKQPASAFLYFVNFFKRKQELDNNRIKNRTTSL